MYNANKGRLAVYALIGCLTNLQFAQAQASSSGTWNSNSSQRQELQVEQTERRGVKRPRPSGFGIPIGDEAKFSAGYVYGDSFRKETGGISTNTSVSTFGIGSSYGFTRNFYGGINLNIVQAVAKQKNTVFLTQNEKTVTSEGLQNPELYLAFQTPRRPFTLIGGVAASLAVQPAKIELQLNGDVLANASSGGHSISPFVIAHNNSLNFLVGGRVAYKIQDQRKSVTEGTVSQSVFQNGNYVNQSINVSSESYTTGGNTLLGDVFMELPRFYGLGIRAQMSLQEQEKRTSGGQTTITDPQNMLSISSYASFEVTRNMALSPVVNFSQMMNKPNNLESYNSISGGVFAGFAF